MEQSRLHTGVNLNGIAADLFLSWGSMWGSAAHIQGDFYHPARA